VLALGIAPLLNWTIEQYGWRASYLGLGAFVLVSGLIAIALTDDSVAERKARQEADVPLEASKDYGTILRNKVFWIIVIAFFLCLLQTQLHSSQMNLMLLDKGLAAQTAANIVPIYALGTIFGRIACGLALDRFSTPMVTFISMVIPALGYVVLGSSLDTVTIISASMFLVGLSVGAESDLICYLVARYFKLRIYSTTLGLVHTCTFLSSAVGGLALSLTLKLTDSFSIFLYIAAGSILIGSVLFLLLPKSAAFEKIG
jgi:sugar phosphate permease